MMATRSQTVSTSPNSCEEKENRFPLVFEPLDDVADFHAAERIQAAGGFVQNQQVGIVDKRLRQAHALLHSFGIRFDQPFAGGFQLDQLSVSSMRLSASARGSPKI